MGAVLDFFMAWVFYIARWLGSPHHVISRYSAAIVFTYVGLASYGQISRQIKGAEQEARQRDDIPPTDWTPVRFGARCTRSGREYVAMDVVDVTAEGETRGAGQWWDEKLALDAVARCDRLADSFIELHTKTDKQ